MVRVKELELVEREIESRQSLRFLSRRACHMCLSLHRFILCGQQVGWRETGKMGLF